MDADDFISDDYLRQICRQEYEALKEQLNQAVGAAVKREVSGSNKVLLDAVDPSRRQVQEQEKC